MKPGLKLRFDDRIPNRAMILIRRFAEIVPQLTSIEHEVRVFCKAANRIRTNKGELAFGVFAYGTCPRTNKRRIRIYLACLPPPEMKLDEWIGFVLETFLHEIAHYEQYRSGSKPSERGVTRRMERMARIIQEMGNDCQFQVQVIRRKRSNRKAVVK